MGAIRRRKSHEKRAACELAVVSDSVEFDADAGSPILFVSMCVWQNAGGAQRPAALARKLREMGRMVFYYAPNQPTVGVDPATGTVLLDRMAFVALRQQLKDMGGIVVCSHPAYAAIAFELAEAGWTLVYDMIDDWAGFERAGHPQHGSIDTEPELCAMADLVTVTCNELGEVARDYGAQRVALVPNGGPGPLYLGDGGACLWASRKRWVFCGSLWGNWLDWDALLALDACEELDGTIIGSTSKIQTGDFQRTKFIGELPHEDALKEMATCSVGVIPFAGPLCHSVDPVKYYDYLAVGIRTVASFDITPLQDGRPGVHILPENAPPEAWPEAVLNARDVGADESRYAAGSTWAWRAKALLHQCDLLDQAHTTRGGISF